MNLIIQKLLDDALTLLSEFWQALWHGGQSIDKNEPPAVAIKHDASGTIHPIV